MNDKWHARYLDLAKYWAQYSKDPNKKCGAVVTDSQYVRGIGYNGFPRGLKDTTKRLQDKVLKLKLIVHAEVNAIAAAQGKGDTIYVWPQLPCTLCLGTVIQNNIKTIVSTRHTRGSWNPHFTLEIASEVGIEVILLSDSEIATALLN